jgi:PhnB protein
MRINPHRSFNGQCREAFKFYEKHLGGKITLMMTWGESPIGTRASPDQSDKILHASLTVGQDVLAGADAPPGHFRQPQGFAVTLDIAEAAEADRVFAALAEGGTVQMPMQETFWALRFGMLIDRFGTPWMINCGRPA